MQHLNLTRRQTDILEYLYQREAKGKTPPTLEEICTDLGLSSRGSMHKHIQALIDADLVQSMNRRQRGVRLTETAINHLDQEGPTADELPLMGYIAAGRPIEAIDHNESIEVPAYLRSQQPCYVLQVRGNSMVDEGILDGDLVVIEQRSQAKNGEIVVALIDNADATLKRIEQKTGETLLHPANSNMTPMSFAPERVQIQGILLGQMRRYH